MVYYQRAIKMSRAYKFTNEQYQEVMELMKITTDAKLHKKLEVLQLRMEGYKNADIAAITKYSASRVSALVCIYAHNGISYFEKEHRISGNRRNISFQEETVYPLSGMLRSPRILKIYLILPLLIFAQLLLSALHCFYSA